MNFEKYLKNKKILIVSSSINQRSSLKKIFLELGCEHSGLETVGTFKEAIALLDQKEFNILVCEQTYSDGPGIDIVKKFKDKYPQKVNYLSLLFVNENSSFFTSEFAKIEGDLLVSTPFVITDIVKALESILSKRSNPKPYEVLIDEALGLENSGKIDEAIKVLEKALSIKPTPSEVLFYLGRFFYKVDNYDRSDTCWNELLAQNPTHYKALLHLVISLEQQKKYEVAHKYLITLLENHPFEIDHLLNYIRVLLGSSKIMDLKILCDALAKLQISPTEQLYPISVSLAVAGKYFLKTNEKQLSFKYLKDSLKFSLGKPKLISMIIENLLLLGKKQDALESLNSIKYEEDDIDSKAYEFLARSYLYDVDTIMKESMKLKAAKVIHPVYFQVMIKTLRKVDKDPSDYIVQAKRAFPDIADEFK